MALFVMFAAGCGFGVLAFQHILLPLYWAWPRARRIGLTVPVGRFVVPSAIWAALTLSSLLLVGGLFSGALSAYSRGLSVGFIVVASFVLRPTVYMERDFFKTYGGR